MFANEKTTPLTAEQFWELAILPEYEDKRLELINGEIVVMPESSPINTIIAGRLIRYLVAYVDDNGLGFVSTPDGGYRLDDGNVRQPDAAFISSDRAPVVPQKFTIAPDIAAEVISPSETAQYIARKVEAYLRSGTRLVWVVYPQTRTLQVWARGVDNSATVTTLQESDTLTGGTVLPGFTLPIAKLFERLPEKMD